MPLDQPHKPTFMHQFCNSFLQGLRVAFDGAGQAAERRAKPRSGVDMVAYGKAGRAAAAIGRQSFTIIRMALAMRIFTRELCAQLTPCGG
jgi:hypothetical protein